MARHGFIDQAEANKWKAAPLELEPKAWDLLLLLAANPYVVMADAAPTSYDAYDNPVDAFGFIKLSVRGAQQAPDLDFEWNECDPANWSGQGPSARDLIEDSTPSWFVGLAIHLVLGGALLTGAISATRTPARKLSPGSRIA